MTRCVFAVVFSVVWARVALPQNCKCYRLPGRIVAAGPLLAPTEISLSTTRLVVADADADENPAGDRGTFKIGIGNADPTVVASYQVVWSIGEMSGTEDFSASGGVITGTDDASGELSVKIGVDFMPGTDLEPISKSISRQVGQSGKVILIEAHTESIGFFVDLKHYAKRGDFLIAETFGGGDARRIRQRRHLLETKQGSLRQSEVKFHVFLDEELGPEDIELTIFGRLGGKGGRKLASHPVARFDSISLLEAYWDLTTHMPQFKVALESNNNLKESE